MATVSSDVRMCEAEGCYRTFWARGPQRYCRNKHCQAERFVASFDLPLQEARTASLHSAERRASELADLIGEQRLDMRVGHRVEGDYRRTGPVMSLDRTTEAVAKAYEAARGYVPDAWTLVVHAKVDFWREVDAAASIGATHGMGASCAV